MTQENMLSAALRYLDREGTIAATDLGFFAVGDPRLYSRLRKGEPCQPGEFAAAGALVLQSIDHIIAKLQHERAALCAALPQ
ncbi:MAG: hypothetical protein H2056_03410 [Sphingopyxis sp.]|nr:hypothetical protein [Sphingopyxis sp.]